MVVLDRCWITEHGVDSLNAATPRQPVRTILMNTTRIASPQSEGLLFNSTGNRVDAIKRSVPSALPCILAIEVTWKQRRKSLRLTQPQPICSGTQRHPGAIAVLLIGDRDSCRRAAPVLG
jgi:hypothetical protein